MEAVKPQQAAGSPEVLYVSKEPPKEQSEMFADFPDLIPVQDMADALQVCPNTVRNLIRSHELPGVKIGNRLFVPKSDFVESVTRKIERGDAMEGGI